MKLSEKIDYLQDNHFSEWLSKRQEADQVVSDRHDLFCICGRLCTGLHEMSCRKFANEVNKLTVKNLSDLIPKVLTDAEADNEV